MTKNKNSGLARSGLCVMTVTACAAMALPLGSQAQPAAESAVLMTATPRPAGKKVALNTPVAKAGPAGTKTAAAPRGLSTPTCVGEFAPAANVNLPEGKSGLLDLQQLRLPSPAWLRIVGDPDVVQVEPLTSAAPRTMFFLFEIGRAHV